MTRPLNGGTAVVATGCDMMSPFPPSGNEGYIRNRDVPFQSVTLSITSMTDEIGHPYQSSTDAAPSSILYEPPAPL